MIVHSVHGRVRLRAGLDLLGADEANVLGYLLALATSMIITSLFIERIVQ